MLQTLIYEFSDPLAAADGNHLEPCRNQPRHEVGADMTGSADDHDTRHGCFLKARDDGTWEGWLAFVSPTHTLQTPRETTQSSQNDVLYWATGLQPTYLEGAFQRARRA